MRKIQTGSGVQWTHNRVFQLEGWTKEKQKKEGQTKKDMKVDVLFLNQGSVSGDEVRLAQTVFPTVPIALLSSLRFPCVPRGSLAHLADRWWWDLVPQLNCKGKMLSALQ